MKINETIEKKVVAYTLKLWFVEDLDETCKKFDTYLSALKDGGLICDKQCDSTDFVDIAFPYFKDKDFIGAIQKILEHLWEVANQSESRPSDDSATPNKNNH